MREVLDNCQLVYRPCPSDQTIHGGSPDEQPGREEAGEVRAGKREQELDAPFEARFHRDRGPRSSRRDHPQKRPAGRHA